MEVHIPYHPQLALTEEMYTYCCGGEARRSTALAHLRELVEQRPPVDTED